MLRILIVDDEPSAIKNITLLLQKYHDLIVVGTCGSVAEARVLIPATRPDLLLLDIQLPDGTGFDLLQSLGKISFHIIFVTAFNEHGIKAIKYGALDYLLKPVDEDDLDKALEKAKGAWLPEKDVMDSLEVIRSAWAQSEVGDRQQIVLKSQHFFQLVALDDIVYCQSMGNYTHFHLSDNRMVVASRTLKEFYDMLPRQKFIRAHHSYLVNVKYIDRLFHKDGYLVLKSGEEIPISIRKKENVLAFFQGS